MNSLRKARTRAALVATPLAAALVLAGCAGGGGTGADDNIILVGTTD